MRSLWHLSRHLTARADDNHAAPRNPLLLETDFHRRSDCVQTRVRFLAYHRIKPHVPPSQTPSNHRLLRGLPGYLILFDTHAFVLQCQLWLGKLPSQSEFCVISMHFTATPRIPPTSNILKSPSFNGNFMVEPQTFTADLKDHLRTL